MKGIAMPLNRAALRFRWWCGASLFAIALATAPLRAATPPGVQEYHTRLPTLAIPFSPNIPGSRVRDVELYISTDQGRTWNGVTQAQISPRREDNRFKHTLQSDGTYWFAVRSIDQAGQAFPANVDQLQPGLVVHLDRREPVVQLRSATPTRPGVVGVEWDIREEHFDPSRFKLEYRVPGQSDWFPQSLTDERGQPVEPKVSGLQFWQLTAAPKIEVRLRVADRAGNEATTSLVLTPGQEGTSTSQPSSSGSNDLGQNTPSNVTTPQRPGTSYINTLQLAIPFRVSNVGVSGVPVTDLWVTRDLGRNWTKVPRPTDDPGHSLPATPDAESVTKQIPYSAPTEGLYGFTVVVRSGVGIGDSDPRPGDKPQRLVEVDVTKPEVSLRVTPGTSTDIRNVTIEWSAKDKNLIDRPVSLLWSKTKEGGEWEPIIGDLDARGKYVWTVTDQGPFQFFVQIRATDRAGNIGSETWKDQVTVDLNRPKGELLDPVPLEKKK